MSQTDNRTVDVFEDGIQWNERGEVVHSPLESLYYWVAGKEPVNSNYLSFVGDDLYRARSFDDVKAFFLEFHGEKIGEEDREAWADPLRADALKFLLPDNHSFYISFVGDYTEQFFLHDKRKVSDNLLDYFSRKDPSQMIVVNSKEPYGYGKGLKKRLFFEVANNEIEWIVKNIWPAAYQGYPIEGYCLTSGKIHFLEKWNDRPKDESLLKAILDESFAIFYTYPEEQRHFAFLTKKLTLSEFKQTIKLHELIKIAKKLE